MNCAHLERYKIDVIRISYRAMHDGEGLLDDQIRRGRTISWKAVKSYLLYNLVNKKETIVNDERNCLGWKNVKYPHKFELIMHLSPENRQYSWKIIKAKIICIVHTSLPPCIEENFRRSVSMSNVGLKKFEAVVCLPVPQHWIIQTIFQDQMWIIVLNSPHGMEPFAFIRPRVWGKINQCWCWWHWRWWLWWLVAPLCPKLQTALARVLDELERKQKRGKSCTYNFIQGVPKKSLQ